MSDEEKYLETIRKWKFHWMTKEPGYAERAMGVDSNMMHHLAKLLARSLDLQTTEQGVVEKLVAVVEQAAKTLDTIKYDLNASVYTLEDDEFGLVFHVRDALQVALVEYRKSNPDSPKLGPWPTVWEMCDQSHEWVSRTTVSLGTCVCCKLCGAIQRDDRKNNPCRGQVKISARVAGGGGNE